MKALSLMAAVLALGLAFTAVDAEAAKRLGGGSSLGVQKKVSPPAKDSAASPAKAPAATAATTPPAATAPQAQPTRSWLGPVAGLAAGLGLAALASHLGFGAGLASMMMIGLLVMAAVVVIGLIMRRRATLPSPAMAGPGRMPYGPVDYLPGGSPSPSRDAAESVSRRIIPHDFDVAGFERQAKVNFMRLQAANDAGNLDDLREFTTPEMFAELKVRILARDGDSQHADVLEIDAEVIEVAEEPSRYVVSILYRGMILEEKDGVAESINEIWHLEKPRHGQSGWLVSGIQQMQ